MIAIFGLLLFGLGNLVSADGTTCEKGFRYDSETDSCVKIQYSDGLVALLNAQCKFVEYTEWQPCMTNFGLQLRTVIQPESGCVVTGLQQAYQIRKCGSDILGIN